MRLGTFVIGICGLTVIAGCNEQNNKSGPVGGPPPSAVPGDKSAAAPGAADDGAFAAGRKIYAANGCTRCHMINGQGGFAGGPGGPAPAAGPPQGGPTPGGPPGGPGGFKGKARGPDLGKVGAKHPADWIAAHVRNPKSHNERSTMTAYPEAKINDADLKALADYLASLK
jgi:mono/diheme cytochrome c family protein